MPDTLTSSTAVDLSRLPAPTIIEQISFETIFAGMVADVQARLPSFDAAVDSDPAVKVLQVAAYREQLIRQDFNDRARKVLVAFATGPDLDHVAAFFNVARLVITPEDPDTGAAAVMENDDDLRERVLLAPDSYSVAGPASAYVYHARTADPGVRDARATSPGPGQVLVSLLGRDGDGTATAEMIEAVEAVVNDGEVRPLTDQVTVASAGIVPFQVKAKLYLLGGPDPQVVIAAASAKLTKLLARSSPIGRSIYLTNLHAALEVEGVDRVVLQSPVADVVVGPTAAAHASLIEITTA